MSNNAKESPNDDPDKNGWHHKEENMFDRLIESEPATADFKNRRSYFMVSTIVVGALFATAVVISIYAADYGLGSDKFELQAMLAPIENAEQAPEPPAPRAQSAPTREQSTLPTRRENMSSVDEPTIVPTTTSSAQNTRMARPRGNFELGDSDTTPNGSGRETSTNGPSSGPAFVDNTPVVEKEPEPEPPPVKKDPPPVRSVSGGVVNGNATSLPKPEYSAAAKAVGAQGRVDVQVTIDESGRVIAANAVNGHVMLRAAAEKAARSARFSPTYLSKVPVKVTGLIVYNFVR